MICVAAWPSPALVGATFSLASGAGSEAVAVSPDDREIWAEMFGDAWRAYAATTPRFIPRVRRHAPDRHDALKSP